MLLNFEFSSSKVVDLSLGATLAIVSDGSKDWKWNRVNITVKSWYWV